MVGEQRGRWHVRTVVTAVHNKGVSTSPVELDEPELDETVQVARPWVTIVWNDPVNLMSYVTYVFQSYFGFARGHADRLMRQVHVDGRAIVATGAREAMERHVEAMHGFGLQATVERAPGADA